MAGYFSPSDNASATATTLIGGYFTNQPPAARAHSNVIGGMFKAYDGTLPTGTNAHGNIYGVLVKASLGASGTGNSTTSYYGISVEGMTGAKPTTTDMYGVWIGENTSSGATNKYGLFVATATAGYKAICIRDTNTCIRSSAAATLDFDATTVNVNADLKLAVAGNGLYIKEGTNATMGRATLVAGTVTVSTTKTTASSEIFLTTQSLGTVAVPCAIGVTARTAATSFVITSACVTDTSTVAWVMVEPAP